jgi:hypothetical protein
MNIPTILAKFEKGSLTFHCEYCRFKHIHGIAGGAGHRQSHCLWPKSPYMATGYNLELSPADVERLRIIESEATA